MSTEPAEDGHLVDALRASYDASPYRADAYSQSAPGWIAAVASLFGVETPDVATARVLEIGCASAGNIIPFAATHPQAQVVGIDLSGVQIDEGRRLVNAIGLTNVELHEADIATMDLIELGRFDFIVAHGVYSWVPDEVQDAMLAAIRVLLTPKGIAYISYNTYPGWKSKDIVRDAMLLATRASKAPADRLRDARRMVDFLESATKPDSITARAVAEFRTRDEESRHAEHLLLHDELEVTNSPCYFVDLLANAAAHGLTYVAEAHPELMFAGNYGAEVGDFVMRECGGSQVVMEQYLDFVADRAFRETLLIHAERAAEVRHELDHDRYGHLHFAANTPATEGPTVLDETPQAYALSGGAALRVADPRFKATFDALTSRWPWTSSRAQVVDRAAARLRAAGLDADPSALQQIADQVLDLLIFQGCARWRTDPVAPAVASVPLRVDDPVRRMAQATEARGASYTFNVWHEYVALAPLDACALPLLNGCRDTARLITDLVAEVRARGLRIEVDGRVLSSDAELGAAMTQYVGALPERLQEMKLLRVASAQI